MRGSERSAANVKRLQERGYDTGIHFIAVQSDTHTWGYPWAWSLSRYLIGQQRGGAPSTLSAESFE